MIGLQLLLGPDRKKVASPDSAAIEAYLRSTLEQEKSWVTLSGGISNYVTASRMPEGGFVVETEIGGRDFHNRIVGEPLALDAVILIFQLFAQENTDWMDDFEWERVDLSEIDYRKAPDTVQGRLI